MPRELTPKLVLRAYCAGLFPMGTDDGQIHWFSPDPRCIFELHGLSISRSLRKTLARKIFQVRFDSAFETVIDQCALRAEGTWISPDIRRVYVELHNRGFAHSVECWRDERLAGGLYGVAIAGAFFGESMFFRETDASKVALTALIERMRQRGMALLDTQWATPHLLSLGAVEIPREEYLRRLAAALELEVQFAAPAAP